MSVPLSPHDQRRFDELARESYRKVFNLAFRLSGNRSDAEELTQEAYYRAYRGFAKFEGDRPFENWIYRIVTRLFLDRARQRRRRVHEVSYDAPVQPDGFDGTVRLETPERGPDPEQALLNDSLSEELERSLAQLTSEQRRLVWMADVEGVSYREIAERTGTPIGTIRSRLHRTHKQLRQILAQVRISDPALRPSFG